MEITIFPLSELPTALGTLRAVCPEPSPALDRFIQVIARLHGVDVDAALLLPTVEETARRIQAPHRRKRLVQLAMITAMVDGRIDRREAEHVAALAQALDVSEPALHTTLMLATEHQLVARFELMRRMMGKFAGEAWRDEKWRGLHKIFAPLFFDGGEDPEIARRYQRLGLLPAESFGRAFWEHITSRGFGFPGEKGGFPERIAFHDLGHVLAGYDTDPEGEIQQAAFQSGFVRNDGFAFLYFGIVQFHLGVKVTPVAEPEVGYFDVEKVLTALYRGAACKVDLSDHWDFWQHMQRPLAEVRAELGIPPLNAPSWQLTRMATRGASSPRVA